ncbi:pumilio domain member 6 [Arachnomyces sp. PD_36]|nr:pumilio domain member 6 [Arachnomyces sp. PD_36]
MAGIKRRVDGMDDRGGKRTKVKKDVSKHHGARADIKAKKSVKDTKKQRKVESSEDEDEEEDELDEEEEAQFDEGEQSGFLSEDEDSEGGMEIDGGEEFSNADGAATKNGNNNDNKSRESHAKQKALAQERKAAKPNADIIARSKKLWERLRRKSHVPVEERKKLVAELYTIVTGRVKDFVFKHDSVRVIQTALKYANASQRKAIAHELKGDYKALAESRYAKFLVGKLLVHGDTEIRDLIIPEFYGHVKRLIRNPEASWILDDIYRTVASKEQKAKLLREWYGPEFAIFRLTDDSKPPSADLSQILADNPEKRTPIMKFLFELINQLVQKKLTGFTMLHDAMLQYFINTKPGGADATEFIELLKGDEEGDLVKNLAFTPSGSRVICLSLAYSNAKDRKLLLRMYRDTVKMLAGDANGHAVILTVYEVVDDTKLTQKSIFPELLNQSMSESDRHEELLAQVNDLTARIPILYLFAGSRTRWLLTDTDEKVLNEIRGIRGETSKKDPEVRRQELVKAASSTLLEFIAARAESLVETSFGCQFITEVLFGADGSKTEALTAVAAAAKSKPEAMESPAAGRMLKSLVQGGRFNNKTGTIDRVEPALNFHSLLYQQIGDDVMAWATGSNPFVILSLVESPDFDKKDELVKTLKKNVKALKKAASASAPADAEGEGKKGKPRPSNSGVKLLLEKIG